MCLCWVHWLVVVYASEQQASFIQRGSLKMSSAINRWTQMQEDLWGGGWWSSCTLHYCLCKAKWRWPLTPEVLSCLQIGWCEKTLGDGEEGVPGSEKQNAFERREELSPEKQGDCFISLPAPPFHWDLLLWRLQLFSLTSLSSALPWVTINPFTGVCTGRYGSCSHHLSYTQSSETPKGKSPKLH